MKIERGDNSSREIQREKCNLTRPLQIYTLLTRKLNAENLFLNQGLQYRKLWAIARKYCTIVSSSKSSQFSTIVRSLAACYCRCLSCRDVKVLYVKIIYIYVMYYLVLCFVTVQTCINIRVHTLYKSQTLQFAEFMQVHLKLIAVTTGFFSYIHCIRYTSVQDDLRANVQI